MKTMVILMFFAAGLGAQTSVPFQAIPVTTFANESSARGVFLLLNTSTGQVYELNYAVLGTVKDQTLSPPNPSLQTVNGTKLGPAWAQGNGAFVILADGTGSFVMTNVNSGQMWIILQTAYGVFSFVPVNGV